MALERRWAEEQHRMAKSKPNEEQLDELREAFDYNDRDGDGRIQLDEFSDMLDELEAEMSEKEVEIGFKDIDTNDDGLIDFQEFVAWWTED
jgi:calmodulin